MKNSIKIELSNHILDCINDEIINNENIDDWHFHCFNEDYYIIGYYNASEWLKTHNLDPFDAIAICQEYENEIFGECRIYDNSESTVNMLAYIYGEELFSDIDATSIKKLKKELKHIIYECEMHPLR